MLTDEEFVQWCQKLELKEQSIKYIQQIRRAPPTRRVKSAVGNVSGRYPSKKMGVTIQFESHRNELAGIYEMEYDPQVLEYYDQPPRLKLVYQAKNGRTIGVLHTPDFFVMGAATAGWEEWKTEEELVRLATQMPARYQKGADQRWWCPPGADYAREFGLEYRLRCNTEINWKLQRNLRFLEDYFRTGGPLVASERREKIMTLVTTVPGITLAELFKAEIKPDEVYALIAAQEIYVNLAVAALASEAEQLPVFLTPEIAVAAGRQITNQMRQNSGKVISIVVGTKGLWNGKAWEIVNTGESQTALLSSDEKIIQLPNGVLEDLVKQGEFTAPGEPIQGNSSSNQQLVQASASDLAEANRRYGLIAAYLRGEVPTGEQVPQRTLYRWLAAWRKAEAVYGYGYVGLLPQSQQRGNRQPKLPALTQKLMAEFIANDYENLKQKGKLAAYAALQKACQEQGVLPPSYKTFALEIDYRPRYEQTEKRQGKRAAYKYEPWYWELEVTTPRHGDRPWEICHIDHTQLDIELVSSRTQVNLGRPWVTFLTDAYSRRIIAIYLTFDPPSYRSCMMVIRECVRRYGRLPQEVVVDGGKEFQSVYFETLLAAYYCTKKTRPGAKPRFGSVCERLFGTANTMLIHNLQGNTQITKELRAVTKAVNPRHLAIWTLGSLYQNLADWAYEFYDNKEHPALLQSPSKAYALGLSQSGLRLHRLIRDDETFRIFTLPTTMKGTAKVVPNQGVKINHIYYWHNSFRNPEIEQTQVPVRYDPYDAGTAYAYIQGAWVSCISQYYSSFHGHSEREIMVVTEELRKQHKNHGKQLAVTARQLAELLAATQTQEAVLLQRLRDVEARDILPAIERSQVDEPAWAPASRESSLPNCGDARKEPPELQLADTAINQEEIVPYEEYW